jgi:rod shape-determining protein MreB
MLFSQDIGVDLGTANTLVFVKGKGIVIREPSVVAVDERTNPKTVVAVGADAKKMIGKTAKNTKIVFPVFEGEIINEKVSAGLLRFFMNKIGIKNKLAGVKALFSVPCGVTAEMLDKYRYVAKSCGVTKVYFAEAPMLSAFGQRIPLNDSTPYFVIDMAGGTTNVAAVTLDGIIAGISVNFGANKISTDIIDFVANRYGLQIGLLTAERLKKEIGSLSSNDSLATVVNGRDLKTGTPKAISIRAMDVIEPISLYYDKISELAISVLKKLPPEVSAEIRHAGVFVSGLASSIYGLDDYYTNKFGMKINISENGQMSVALGGGVAMGNDELLKKITIKA